MSSVAPATTLRRATAADFLALAALDRVAWQANRHADFIPDGEHAWRMWCEHALVWVAEHGPEATIVGGLLAFPTTQPGVYCFHKVFTAAEVRGQGVGSALLQTLTQTADQRGLTLFLTVDPVNTTAYRLYQQAGFTQEILVPGFYRPEEDRLVLTRYPAKVMG